MKVQLVKNTETQAGVELRITHDDGNIEVKAVRISKDQIAFELPDNPSNRRFVNIKNFYKANVDEMELEFKEKRVITNVAPRVPLEDYLDDEQKHELKLLRAQIDDLMEIAKANKIAANKKAPLTPLEKARRELERAQAKVAQLTGGNN